MGLLQIIFGADVRGLDRKLDLILETQRKQGEQMALDFNNIEREVAEMGDQIESSIVVNQAISAELREIKASLSSSEDQAKLEALAATLDAHAKRLAAAIVSTPAEPVPLPPVEEPPAAPVEEPATP